MTRRVRGRGVPRPRLQGRTARTYKSRHTPHGALGRTIHRRAPRHNPRHHRAYSRVNPTRRAFSDKKRVSLTPKTRTLCGKVGLLPVGADTTVYGWVESVRALGNLVFAVVRDWSGRVQVVWETDLEDRAHVDKFARLAPESVVCVRGRLRPRPDEMIRKHTPNGGIEIEISSYDILNECTADLPFPPFPRGDQKLASEDARMATRYVDLRRDTLQHALRTRSRLGHALRCELQAEGFVDVETPTLFKSTPEGAREFIVPTRGAPGRFYALAQSPQQYKQLLMAGGLDRYFQFARCYRDEGGRGDRQPEFTQVDIEMSFVEQPEDVMGIVEETLRRALAAAAPNPPLPPEPLRRISFSRAMADYGTDKPDTRYELRISSISDLCVTTDGSWSTVGLALNAKGLGSSISRKGIDQLKASVQDPLASRVFAVKVGENGHINLPGPLRDQVDAHALASRLDATQGDLLLLLTDTNALKAAECMGRFRTRCAEVLSEQGLMTPPGAETDEPLDALWVTDFPLFEQDDDGVLSSSHHPFTAPARDQWGDLEAALDEILPFVESGDSPPEDSVEKLLSIRGMHYDLVMNGCEVGGGSIRLHDANLQEKVLRLLRAPQGSFEHLTQALRLGCPPHGGIALGFDRLVGILCDAGSIRDVIAFPKSSYGNEPLTGAPSSVSDDVLREYNIAVSAPAETDE